MKRTDILIRYGIPVSLICIVICCLCCFYLKYPVTTVILVRHADRTGTIDQLNTDGIIRAQELARILDEANISAIYASTANRTQQTADPLATQIGINATIYDTSDLAALADDIKTNHKGEVILVVGHSNTVPQTINLLGITPALPDIPYTEFDNLYIVTLTKKSNPRLLKIEYGADTQ